MNTREELSKSIMSLKKERDRYLQLIKPDNGKLTYINCKKCGSAIRTDFFTGYTGKVCPACHNDMATEHEKDTIHLFDTLISELTFQKVASPVPRTEAKINIEAKSSWF